MTFNEYAGLLCYNRKLLSSRGFLPKADLKGPGLLLGLVDLEEKKMDPGGTFQTKLFLFGPKLATHCDLRGINRYLVVYVLFYFVLFTHASPAKPCDKNCVSGKCINGSCICDRGWVGDLCQHCQGRFK